jgi:hypothetical protein
MDSSLRRSGNTFFWSHRVFGVCMALRHISLSRDSRLDAANRCRSTLICRSPVPSPCSRWRDHHHRHWCAQAKPRSRRTILAAPEIKTQELQQNTLGPKNNVRDTLPHEALFQLQQVPTYNQMCATSLE